MRVLKSLAAKVGEVLSGNNPRDAEDLLRDYAKAIEPWAEQVAANMVLGVERDNLAKFKRLASRMGYAMQDFLARDVVGKVVAARIEANTALIKSLPLEAAIKAGELAHESLVTGMRADDIVARLYGIGGATKSRVQVIALTEVSKAHTALTKARAEDVGSEGYIWRSIRDGATRPSHRAMEGKFVKWSEPPTLDGMKGHAGEFPNCRCYPEPVIPRSDGKGVYGSPLPTFEQERESGKKPLLSQWEKTIGSEVISHLPGQPLLNVDKAQFAPEKLTGYSMNAEAINKETGAPNMDARAKAKSWKHWLDFTDADAPKVQAQVMAMLAYAPALPKQPTNQFGQRFNVYIPVTGNNGRTVDVMTAWIYEIKDGVISTRPRMTNCFIDGKIGKDGQFNGKED